MKGYFALVIHTHMPYVRKNGVFPMGEDWLYQAISNSYIPLLGVLSQLDHEGLTSSLGLTLTPVLCEQLADPHIQEGFIRYLKTMCKHTENDIRDFEHLGDPARKALAQTYLNDYQRQLLAYHAIDGDILGAFESFEEKGLIETIACSATHAFLPLQRDPRTVEYQVRLGIDSHRRHLGVNPRGFWLPECAYRNGVERILESEGIEYFQVDPSAVPGLSLSCPYRAGDSEVAFFPISDRAGMNVWDLHTGYPTDGSYADTTKYYHSSGLYYWRVTGLTVPIEKKELYEPRQAMIRALDHSRHYIDEIAEELDAAGECVSRDAGTGSGISMPLVMAVYDTELFGHYWKEGPYWLEITLRSMAASERVAITTPSTYLTENRPAEATTPLETSWSIENRDHSTWMNPGTEWIWRELSRAQEKYFELRSCGFPLESPESSRAAAQARRELLLLESSDWPFLVARERASQYATERFNSHLERYWKIVGALESGKAREMEDELAEIEEIDNIFPELGPEQMA